MQENRLCPGAASLGNGQSTGQNPKQVWGRVGEGWKTDTNVLGKWRTEGPAAGGHKPQPAAASTVSHQRPHSARPATSQAGSSSPATVLSHSTKTLAQGIWALQLAFCCSCRDSPQDNVFPPFTTWAQRKTRLLFVPRLHLGRGLVSVVPLPWAKGNVEQSCCCSQS